MNITNLKEFLIYKNIQKRINIIQNRTTLNKQFYKKYISIKFIINKRFSHFKTF